MHSRPSPPPPSFTTQVPGLLVDLRKYLQTLQAVHSGADLGSASGAVMGFAVKSMKGRLGGQRVGGLAYMS
eukprot:354360-Chlamydomonas_euryale.AAC.2